MNFNFKRKPGKCKNGRQGEGGGAPKKYTYEWINNEAKIFELWLKKNKNKKFIWLKDFAISRGYSCEFLSRFAKENKKFNQIMRLAKEIQESKIVKGGIEDKLNPRFSIFLLRCKHGYTDNNNTVVLQGDKENPIETNHKITVDADKTAQVISILSRAGALQSGTDQSDDSETD